MITNQLTAYHASQFETQHELSKTHEPIPHYSPVNKDVITDFTFKDESNGINQHFIREFCKGKAKTIVRILKHKRVHKVSLVLGVS